MQEHKVVPGEIKNRPAPLVARRSHSEEVFRSLRCLCTFCWQREELNKTNELLFCWSKHVQLFCWSFVKTTQTMSDKCIIKVTRIGNTGWFVWRGRRNFCWRFEQLRMNNISPMKLFTFIRLIGYPYLLRRSNKIRSEIGTWAQLL